MSSVPQGTDVTDDSASHKGLSIRKSDVRRTESEHSSLTRRRSDYVLNAGHFLSLVTLLQGYSLQDDNELRERSSSAQCLWNPLAKPMVLSSVVILGGYSTFPRYSTPTIVSPFSRRKGLLKSF
jgi:hypothetical protein